MNHHSLGQVDRALSRRPRLQPAPPLLHDRVMARIAATRAGSYRARRRTAAPGWLGLAACMALAAGTLALYDRLHQGEPAAGPAIASAGGESAGSVVVLDPAPLLLPAAHSIGESLHEPLLAEARLVLDDTRRAADFVVKSLPFAGER